MGEETPQSALSGGHGRGPEASGVTSFILMRRFEGAGVEGFLEVVARSLQGCLGPGCEWQECSLSLLLPPD